jgi:hypothetical protein
MFLLLLLLCVSLRVVPRCGGALLAMTLRGCLPPPPSSQGPFVVLAWTGGAIHSNSIFAGMWKEYAKADTRWGVFDANIVALGALAS